MAFITPLVSSTDEELLRNVFTKLDPTDLELELAMRLERCLDELDSWSASEPESAEVVRE